MITLKQIWDQVEIMLQDGLSLIPVRDKQDGDKLPKTPCQRSWTPYQTTIIDKGFLYSEMEKYDTTAVAIVCGPVSGNLEVIDIDSKYKEGISAELFTRIKDVLPELYAKIRVHKTPSGGYHILYRIENPPEEFPGNLKLAGRPATPEELKAKPKNKVYNFLETRGDKGYVLAPPSMDYGVRFDRSIPVITWSERCDIINICQSFNEIIVYKPTVKPKKSEENYYDLTPWEDFNQRGDVVDVLQKAGWKVIGQKGNKYLYFTRPGKDKGVSASLNLETRVLWSYTVSTELEEKKGYKPVDLLLLLEFNNDTKRCYRFLTGAGYGMVKHKVEQSIIKKAAISGKAIPTNFTPEAKQMFEELKIEVKEDFPYGVFWQYDDEGKIELNKRDFRDFLTDNGVFRFRVTLERWILIQVVDNIVTQISKAEIKSIVSQYVDKEESADVYEYIANNVTKTFSDDWLELLPEATIEFKRDDAESSSIFYENGFLHITKDKKELRPYSELDGFIWNTQILNRKVELSDKRPESDFERFIYNVSGGGSVSTPEEKDKANKRYASVCSAIGYLIHGYKNPACLPAVILNDEVISENPEGRTGKGLIAKSISKFKNTVMFDGKTFGFDKSFVYQKVDLDSEIMFFDDVKENFSFESLFSVITNGVDVEKKGKGAFTIPFERSPKVIVTTNYAIKGGGGSNDARKFELELHMHYTKDHTPKDEFGKLFFDEWTLEEWNLFDLFMSECVQLFLREGLIPQELVNLPEKKLINDTSIGFVEFMDEWIHGRGKKGEVYAKSDFYLEFNPDYPVQKFPSKIMFGKWCKRYFEFHRIGVEDYSHPVGGAKCLRFI